MQDISVLAYSLLNEFSLEKDGVINRPFSIMAVLAFVPP